MHELSNDGAKKKFEVFLEKDIVPEMAQNAMVSGAFPPFLSNITSLPS